MITYNFCLKARSENGCGKLVTVFSLKYGQDLENRAAHPHQEFPGVPPVPTVKPSLTEQYVGNLSSEKYPI